MKNSNRVDNLEYIMEINGFLRNKKEMMNHMIFIIHSFMY